MLRGKTFFERKSCCLPNPTNQPEENAHHHEHAGNGDDDVAPSRHGGDFCVELRGVLARLSTHKMGRDQKVEDGADEE